MIRLANEKDIDLIVHYENKTFNSVTRSDFVNHYFNNPLYQIYMIEDNKVVIGYMVIWLDLDKSQIYTIYILENYRQLGHGYQALVDLEKILVKQGVHTWSLEVRPSNQKAIHLYQKLGFQTQLIRQDYYSNHEDAFLMIKKI